MHRALRRQRDRAHTRRLGLRLDACELELLTLRHHFVGRVQCLSVDEALLRRRRRVLEENRLGLMGPPVKVLLKGQPVFLCCKSCEEEALTNPDQTLAKVEKLKAKAKAGSPQQ